MLTPIAPMFFKSKDGKPFRVSSFLIELLCAFVCTYAQACVCVSVPVYLEKQHKPWIYVHVSSALTLVGHFQFLLFDYNGNHNCTHTVLVNFHIKFALW